jgi:TPR repeat protein
MSRSTWQLKKDVGSFCPNADLGNADAQYQIGNLYNFTYGNPKRDPISAYVWYSLAADGGNLEAEKYLRFVASELNHDQLEEAQHRLEHWKPGQCRSDLLGEINNNQ